MTLSPENKHPPKERQEEYELLTATIPTGETVDSQQKQEKLNGDHQLNEGGKEKMVTPTRTAYLSNGTEDPPVETKLTYRVQSTCSLVGLAKLEGHEDDIEDDIEDEYSNSVVSAVTDEQDIGILLSPSTTRTASPSQDIRIEDESCMTTPPGSVQQPGVFSLSPPRLTTYSAASVTSASVTESLVLQPRPMQSTSRSPMVHSSQLQPPSRSRPPRAPHHHSQTPRLNDNGNGPTLVSRSVGGAGAESSSGILAGGSGHQRTPTDATNYSFLSSLTEATGGEYSTPRRRTLSWDNSNSVKGKPPGSSRSAGGPSTPGSILQPILLTEEEMHVATRPPLSISASNLRKMVPSKDAPVPPSYATPPRNPTKRQPLTAPLSLPSQDNLHPLIKQLHQISSTKSTPFTATEPQISSGDEKNNIHPLLQNLQRRSNPMKSGQTASTAASSPFTPSLQDEKKDDETDRFDQTSTPHRQSLERRNSGYLSYASSQCSKTTVSLQKRPMSASKSICGGAIRKETKHSANTRFVLKDVLGTTRESTTETEILEKILRDSKFAHTNSDPVASGWQYLLYGFSTLGITLLAGKSTIGAAIAMIAVITVVLMKETTGRACGRTIFDRFNDGILDLRAKFEVVDNIIVRTHAEMHKTDLDHETIESMSKFVKSVIRKTDLDHETIESMSKFVKSVIRMLDEKDHSSLCFTDIRRESFIEASQILFEHLGNQKYQYVISLESIAKSLDGSVDKARNETVLKLFYASKDRKVSKLDFVESMDSLYKTTIFLIANMASMNKVFVEINGILEVVLCLVGAMTLPGILWGSINTSLCLVFGLLVNFNVVAILFGREYIKGILRVATTLPYAIGNRIHFIEDTVQSHPDGPPSGGWVIEGIDLHSTTLRHGITGERRQLSNGSPLLEPSRIVNWNRSRKANVVFSLKTPINSIAREQIQFFQSQISEWVESRPREWTDIGSFELSEVVDEDNQKCMKYEFVLRHRESWQNYPVVQESKSDLLLFLHELQNCT